MPGWQKVDRPRQPVLFVNERSGGGRAVHAQLAQRARERGIEPISLAPNSSLDALVDEAIADGADALAVAGGDGSLGLIAAVASRYDVPFVCVPAGTRNHFALDLGVARDDLVGALDAFTEGLERRIDLGEVSGRPFLNNVSLGIYGDAVSRRGYRDAKLRALLETAEEVLASKAATPGLRLVDDMGDDHNDPAVVLVSNNPYALDRPLARGTRPALDTGRLGIVVLDPPSPGPHAPAHAWSALELEVHAPAPVHAGIDGEAVELAPPLRFAIRPRALRVRISARHPGVSPSARLPSRPARRRAR